MATALDEITGGALEKLVIARRAWVRGERPFDVGRLLALLGCPTCNTCTHPSKDACDRTPLPSI